MTAFLRRRRIGAPLAIFGVWWLLLAGVATQDLAAQTTPAGAALPALSAPVNDFAGIVAGDEAREIERVIRTLQAASGDIVVVATVPTIEPFADIREYAVKLFENRGQGIGTRGQDNGALILLAVKERSVWIEVGYGLEPWITDGFAGETARAYMVPEFREGRYGSGLLLGTTRVAARIAQGRNVQLTGVEIPQERRREDAPQLSLTWIVLLFILIVIISRSTGGPGRQVRGWGRSGWSGWSSGVGPFGGGFGGGSSGGGGFGGGFGGFGGGRSGGGGGGGRW